MRTTLLGGNWYSRLGDVLRDGSDVVALISCSPPVESDLFLLKSFRVPRRFGLIGGIGGASSIPFFKEAPGGRSTVSTFEVEDISFGSEMSAFEIVILRKPPGRADEGVIGECESIDGLELVVFSAGVWFCEYGFATGTGRPGVYPVGVVPFGTDPLLPGAALASK